MTHQIGQRVIFVLRCDTIKSLCFSLFLFKRDTVICFNIQEHPVQNLVCSDTCGPHSHHVLKGGGAYSPF